MELEKPEPIAIKTFFRIIHKIRDPRRDRGQRHDFAETLLIALLAMLCGADNAEGFESWGEQNESWLRKYLTLPHGIPSQDTFLRLFAILDHDVFVSTVTEWVKGLLPSFSAPQICIDGKTARASRSGGKSARHIVNAWLVDAGIVLGQTVVDTKENEIVAIPKVLRSLDIHGATVTIDAMGCQREIASQIVAQGGKYVLTVKDNQPTLKQDLSLGFEEAIAAQKVLEPKPPALDTAETIDKCHGRLETRRCVLTKDIRSVFGDVHWPHIAAAAKIERTRQHLSKGNIENETVYVISSDASATAQGILDTVRAHWSIENQLHWQLDVTFAEDQWTGRTGHAAQNMSFLRKLALYLLAKKPAPSRKKRSLKIRRFYCNANEDYRLAVLSGLVPATP